MIQRPVPPCLTCVHVSQLFPETRFRSRGVRKSRRISLALYGLVTVSAAWALLALLTSPGGVETQARSSFGCRGPGDVLLLTLQSDGLVLWPDGQLHNLEESKMLLVSSQERNPDRVLALLAAPEARLQPGMDLLEAVRLLGVTRAVLATPANYRLP